jgi:hypothetical protein
MTQIHRLALLGFLVAAIAAPFCLFAQKVEQPPATESGTSLSTLRAGPTTLPADVAARAEQLIAQLSNAQWKERHSAESALARIGPLIVPRLKRALLSSTDEEVRNRLEIALDTIDYNRRFGPSSIYLDADNEQLKQVVDQMLDQADAPPDWTSDFILGGAAWPAITLKIRGESFWSVVLEIQKLVGLSPTAWRPSSSSMPGISSDCPIASVDGPFITVPYRVDLHRVKLIGRADVGLGGAGLNQGLNAEWMMVSCLFLTEPKLHLIDSSRGNLWTIETARDDQGNNLNNYQVKMFMPGPFVPSFDLQMACPAASARTVHRLTGKYTVMVERAHERIEVTDPLHAQTVKRTIGGQEFTIHTLQEDPDMGEGAYELKAEITYDPFGSKDLLSLQSLAGQPDIKLLDSDGEPRYQIERGGSTGDDKGLKCDYVFSSQPGVFVMPNHAAAKSHPPALLVWRISTGSQSIDAHFDFHDLPLP